MLLYVNGHELSAGAGAVNNYVQANDDIHHVTLGNRAHPDNAVHSYGYYLSRLLNLGFICDASRKKSNAEIIDQTQSFLKNKLPRLKSQYTVICIELMPKVDVQKLNQLVESIKNQKLQYIIFNSQQALPANAQLTFGNYLDLKDQNQCFSTWCKNNHHTIQKNLYPTVDTHNAWAKYIFGHMIQEL